MLKELKEKLQNTKIKSKWCNMGTWQKEEWTNLLEFVEKENIKIKRNLLGSKKKEDNYYLIEYSYGMFTIIVNTNIVDIQKDLCVLLAQKNLYLGDKYKIETPYRDYKF